MCGERAAPSRVASRNTAACRATTGAGRRALALLPAARMCASDIWRIANCFNLIGEPCFRTSCAFPQVTFTGSPNTPYNLISSI